MNSDTDYVCVFDHERPVLRLPANSSVSFYSVGRMTWMVENSKLFVQHLINDGIAISENRRHRKLIASFKIKREILQKDLELFTGALLRLSWIPNSERGKLWAFDYVYTLARNVVYISNALDNYCQFGYAEAVAHFLSGKKATSLQPHFMDVREKKYLYRSGDAPSSNIEIVSVERLLAILTGQEITLRLGGVSNLHEIEDRSYEFLRLVERAVINGEISDDGYIEKLKKHGDYFFSLRRHAHCLTETLRRSSSLSERTFDLAGTGLNGG